MSTTTLSNNNINTIIDKARILQEIDSADIQGYYNKANMLSKIYEYIYIDNNIDKAKWLYNKYKVRYGTLQMRYIQ
jgi:hypothetical protein